MRMNRATAPTDPEAQAALFEAGASIAALRPTPKDPSLVGVVVGRKRVGVVDAGELDALGLRVGAAWTPDLAARVARAGAAARAHRFMLRSLGARAQSRGMVLDRLRRKGFDDDAARAAVERLERAGLIDDEAFAHAMARTVLSRGPVGVRRLQQTLLAKRLDRDLADRVAREALADRDGSDDALALARRRARSLPASLDERAASRRIYAYLARRGFEADACARAVRTALRTDPNTPGDD